MDFPKRAGGPGLWSFQRDEEIRTNFFALSHMCVLSLLFFVDEQKVVFGDAKPNAGNKLALDCTTQQEAGGGFGAALKPRVRIRTSE